jgi:hypothetical protein
MQEVTIFLIKTSKSLNPGDIFRTAALFGRLCTLIYLKKQTNLDLLKKDSHQNTTLHLLSGSGYVQSAVCLIHWLQAGTSRTSEKKNRVNPVNKEGFTPLHFAALSNSLQMCKYLLFLGADPHKTARNGLNPYQLARSQGASSEILKVLKPRLCSSFKTRGNSRFFLNFLFLFTRYVLFLLFLLPKVSFFLAVVSLSLSATVIFLLVCVSSVDPGFAKSRKEALERLVALYSERTCTKCVTVQFEEDMIKHCWNCQRCVERYDHHCDWIRNCVGKKNSKVFIVYLSFFLAEMGFHCFLIDYCFFDKQLKKEEVRILILMGFVLLCTVFVTLWVLRVFIWQVRRLLLKKTSFQLNKKVLPTKRPRSVYEDFRQVSALTLRSRYWFNTGTINETYP